MKFLIGLNLVLFFILIKYFLDIYRSLKILKTKPELRKQLITKSKF